jgi:hypothetical protein
MIESKIFGKDNGGDFALKKFDFFSIGKAANKAIFYISICQITG